MKKAQCVIKIMTFSLAFILSLLQIQIAHASPILIWNNSFQEQLIGANQVNVMGILFDVRFIDGSCDSIWSGCDRNKFRFPDEELATLASQALLDQVLLDDLPLITLDRNPWKVFGVDDTLAGAIFTPYAHEPGDEDLTSIAAINFGISAAPWEDRLQGSTEISVSFDMSESSSSVYARWSASVPEPSSITLLVVGLAGLGFSRRKLKLTLLALSNRPASISASER